MRQNNADAEKAEVSTQVDARIGRALTEFLYAEQGQYGEQTYRVHSGSGETYAVDLDGPDGYHCSCPDTDICKHLLHVLLVERPQTFRECEHGDPRCPGVEAISIEDGEPVCDRLPCFDCFQEACRDRNDEPADTDTKPMMADGGQPTLTSLDAGLIVTDGDGVEWTVDTPVEQIATPSGYHPRTRLVSETGDIRRLDPRTFVEAVEAEDGEFTLVEADR